ncbi:MAG: ArsR/SmtB family transcription factor [Pseudorhizobium sp.]
MDKIQAISALSALGQQTRIDVFRLIVQNEPDGMAAGDVARQLVVPQNTMSTHLGILVQAGLLRSERRSRSIIYRAELDHLRAVLLYLIQDCCGGNDSLCQPLIDDLACCSSTFNGVRPN